MSLNERVYLASRVYASLVNFAHWQDVKRSDVEAAYRVYLDKVVASEDRFAFSRASLEFLATLHNGHTMFLDMALIRHGGDLPFAATFVDDKWVATESRHAELKPGDVIETIDNQDFEQFFASQRRFINASTERWARRAMFARLPDFTPGAHLFPEQFVLGISGGRQVKIDRRAVPSSPLAGTEGRWLEPGRVAYLRIPSFMNPSYQKRAVELVGEFRDAAVLIVDVRGNMGGSTPEGLTQALMDRPYRWWTESTPAVLPYFRYEASRGDWQFEPFESPDLLWRSPVREPGKEHFKGKLALLVDGGCNSACEDFVMPFKDNGRALIVGQTTAGSSGQPYMLDLGDQMMLMVGAKREMFPDGSRFEGVGIKPDVEAAPTIEDIRRGRDRALESALTQARGRG